MTEKPGRERRAPSLFLPRRLPGRLAFFFVSGTVVTLAIIAIIVLLVVGNYTRSVAEQEASALLAHVSTEVALRADAFDSDVDAALAGSTLAADEANTANTAALAAALAADLPDASAWVLAGESGAALVSGGPADDVAALTGYASGALPDGGIVVTLPSGPGLVAAATLAESAQAGPDGAYVLIAARPLIIAELADGWSCALLPGATAIPEDGEWTAVDAPAGYLAASTLRDGERLATRAALAGSDEAPAVVVEFSQPDPWLGDNSLGTALLFSAGLVLLAIGIGYLVSRGIGAGAVRSLRSYVDYLNEQGYLALQGLRPDAEIVVDERMPEEMAQLGEAIKGLLTQLRLSQIELIETSDQAAAAERAFRTIVEESPELKILVRGGVVEIANPAAAHFFGLQMGDLLRAEPTGLFSGVQLFDEEGTELELREVARLAREESVVARCVAEGQPDRWIELSVALIGSGHDDYVLSARNITEERRLEALRAEVMSLVSHDLRSPLTVVRGYIDILDRDIPDTQRRKALNGARRSTEHMEQLLDDLLHATRVERVFAPRIMRPINFGSLASSVAASLQTTAVQEIAVNAELDVIVLGDPMRLRQAVTNLVGNAIKHGPHEGDILIEVSAHDGRAFLTVQDEGSGVPEGQWERLFERGTRGEQSASTPGMGLGLYIVRVVAEAHSGSAYVEAADGGMRFVIELPLVAE